MHEHIRIRSQDVFNDCTFNRYRDSVGFTGEHIIQLCSPQDDTMNIFGRSKITFFAYDYFNEFPFSKFAATYNGIVYDVRGTLIGPLTLATLHTLQPKRKQFQACFVTQITYMCKYTPAEPGLEEECNTSEAESEEGNTSQDDNSLNNNE